MSALQDMETPLLKLRTTVHGLTVMAMAMNKGTDLEGPEKAMWLIIYQLSYLSADLDATWEAAWKEQHGEPSN